MSPVLIDNQLFLLEKVRQAVPVERAADGKRAAQRMARLVQSQSLESPAHREQRRFASVHLKSLARNRFRLGADKIDQFLDIGNLQFDQRHLPAEFFRYGAQRGSDDKKFSRVDANLIQIAQPSADLRIFLHELVKIFELEYPRFGARRNKIENRQWTELFNGFAVRRR